MARRLKLDFILDVAMIPMPEEHGEAWRAGILLLLNILKNENLICTQGGFLADAYGPVASDYQEANPLASSAKIEGSRTE